MLFHLFTHDLFCNWKANCLSPDFEHRSCPFLFENFFNYNIVYVYEHGMQNLVTKEKVRYYEMILSFLLP